MSVKSFRDLIAWQKSVDLLEAVYRLTSEFPDAERWGLVSQLRRAAVSVSANIAEGHGRGTVGEFLHQLSVARGSLNEVRALLAIAHRLGVTTQASVTAVDASADEVARILWGLRRKVRRTAVTS